MPGCFGSLGREYIFSMERVFVTNDMIPCLVIKVLAIKRGEKSIADTSSLTKCVSCETFLQSTCSGWARLQRKQLQAASVFYTKALSHRFSARRLRGFVQLNLNVVKCRLLFAMPPLCWKLAGSEEEPSPQLSKLWSFYVGENFSIITVWHEKLFSGLVFNQSGLVWSTKSRPDAGDGPVFSVSFASVQRLPSSLFLSRRCLQRSPFRGGGLYQA